MKHKSEMYKFLIQTCESEKGISSENGMEEVPGSEAS